MESTSSSTSSAGLDDLSILDFLQHPDTRSISCFFLGCLLFAGFRQFTRSLSKIIYQRRKSLAKSSFRSDVEVPHIPTDKRVQRTSEQVSQAGWKSVDTRLILLATMGLSFTISSVLEMLSLLSFTSEGGASRCGGLVITAGVLEHLATLLAFVYTSIEVKLLGAGKWEQRGFLFLVLPAFGLQCVEAALTTFSVNDIPTLGFGFCWRTRPAVICAVNAVIVILCSIYVSARLYASVVPEPTFALRSQIATLGDARVARALSLLLLGLLIFLPGIASVGVAGDVIPMAIGSVTVLELFGTKNPDSTEPCLPSDGISPGAIRVELFPEPVSPTGRSVESHALATSPKSASLSAVRLMELTGPRIAIKSMNDDGGIPTPIQTGSSHSRQTPIVPRLAHFMNTAYPPSPTAPSISQESVVEFMTARRIKRPGTGTTTGKSIRSARPVSFLTNQNPWGGDRGIVPPSPGSAARTEFELTTLEDDDGLTRTATMSTNIHAGSRRPSATASNSHGDLSRAATSSTDRRKSKRPGTGDSNRRAERSAWRRTFGAESHRTITISRGASSRQSIPPTPSTEYPPTHPTGPSPYMSKQLPSVPPS